MAKRKFIRHLEYYGFPDQNVYNGLPNIDLSDIREVNREQDKEITEISGETQNKADLNLVLELSGKVDTFIDVQSAINEEFLNSVSGITNKIVALEERDVEITNKINELTDKVNEIDDIEEGVGELWEGISALSESLSAHVEDFDAYMEATSTEIDSIYDELSGKVDADFAEETYAKKGDCYTKEESDELFLKVHQDISHLATKEELAYVQSEVESIDLTPYATKEELSALSESFDEYKETAEEKFSDIDDKINNIENSISSLTNDISSIEEEIEGINGKISDVSGHIITIEEILPTKVDNTEFAEFESDMLAALATKADEEELNRVKESANTLSIELQQEKAERISGDTKLTSDVADLNVAVSDLEQDIIDVNARIDEVSDDLAQEIQDRINGDIALIGTEDDTMADDTIWGAKKYAINQKLEAEQYAESYVAQKITEVENRVDNKFDEFDTRLSAKADKTYVDRLVEERVTSLDDELNDRIDREVETLNQKDANLETEIEDLRQQVASSDTKDIYKRINVITTYSGDTPEEYIDSGNGILDVLHREFHQLEEEIGAYMNPTLEKKNEYESAFGKYNISRTGVDPSERTIFTVGIGQSNDDRRNALEVREDGTLMLWVEGDYMNVNDLLAMLAHEVYN